ncbi:DUF4230 domain-containing protein [Parvibacter caecicola]|uniref:DUF4230 domain-containing protein n=1 Tax=Parvibacter caecicola TaxID=747645 RepID=UPI00272F3CEC|nr:DUF4230 domain-containing protein [Parvibacter caecicola]
MAKVSKAGGFLKVAKTKWFAVVVSLLVGILLGVGSVFFLQNYNPRDDKSLAPSVVFARIQSQNELVAASQDYCIVDKVTDKAKFFDLFDLPWTENSFWYRYQGTIKVGVNLEKAEFSEQGGAVSVKLDQPYIISNTPDMEQSGVLEERNNIFNNIDVADIDEFQRQCIETSEAQALDNDLLQTARENAEANIRGMFQAALGEDVQVNIVWR